MPHAPETFVHLHNHTEYSLLDGASRIHAMVARAAELGMPALALTDHGVMYGAIHFYKACKAAGIKPILGFEAYVAPRNRTDRDARADRDPYHLTVLAASEEGYRNLMALCTIGQKEGLYYKPRIDRDVLSRHSEGLIVLSGCLGGEVATKVTSGDLEGARETIATYRDIFTPDRYLLEVQRHGIAAQERVNEALRGFSDEFGLRLVATNDLHYVHQHDAEPHDVLLCLQTGANFEDPKRWRFDSQEFYLKTPAEMVATFQDMPQAVANSLEVAEQVAMAISMGKSLLPPFEIPAGLTHDEYLRTKTAEGLRWRYADDPPKAAWARMDVELEVIRQTGYASYFLIVADFYEFARKQGVVTGPGRGSAVGSLVAFSLGITNLDPLEHGLLFERFLNKDRVSMPDIDCDFSVEGRERVIRYVSEKYGADRVAQIVTFTTMASKAAIRDVGRVLEVPLKETDRLSKLIPVHQGRSKSLDDAIKEVPEFREAYEAPPQQGPDGRQYHLRRLIDVARPLEGVSRNVSVHAAGVVIAPDKLELFAPTQWGPRSAGAADDQPRQVITQYDMKAVGDIGLLKMDFLGLLNLDIISTCLKLIREQRGEDLDLLKLGFGDGRTYELISDADTHGVFQLEGSGMRRMLQEMKPQSFADVTAAIALFRPGPMQNIPAYIARKQGREQIEYMHPLLEPILKDSYGVMIYQEQVMMAARALAGFTLSEADILRAAMGKKDAAKMAQQRVKFVDGCAKNGIDKPAADELFDAIAKFASYGFNRSHAAAYAMISYQTAYLKASYPVEYMTSLLTHMQGSADKVAAAIVDAKKRSLEVVPPDVNESRADFSIVGGRIRFGLAAIKNVGRGAVEQIVQERDRGGPFKSLDDFCGRMAGVQDVNARALDSLVRSGACDVFGERNLLLASLDGARQRAEQVRRDRESGQISLFGLVEEPEAQAPQANGIAAVPPMLPEDRLKFEKELLGLYLSDHPLNRIEAEVAEITDTQLNELTAELIGREVRIGGLVRAWRRVVTRKGQIMAYAEVEDLTGMVEVTFFPRAYDDFRRFMEAPDAIVIIQGKVEAARGGGGGRGAAPAAGEGEELEAEEEEREAVTLIADAVWDWEHRHDIEPLERQRVVHVDVPDSGPEVVDQIARLLARHAGSDEVQLHFRVQGSEVTVQVGERFRVTGGHALKTDLDMHFQREVTRLETIRPRVPAGANGNGKGHGRNGNGRSNGR
ncbi:MAG TPA: DNA polymerase III subunit alpha [Candidatus Dormibacteraeota bacterium]